MKNSLSNAEQNLQFGQLGSYEIESKVSHLEDPIKYVGIRQITKLKGYKFIS